MFRSWWRQFALISCLLTVLATPVSAEIFRVEDIRVDGLQRISAGTVFNYLPLKPGEWLENGQTASIIRALYKTGFFKDVRLEREGNVLVVVVQERPAISEINFDGNKAIEDEALEQGLKDIGLSPGRTFNRSVLDQIAQELKRQYFNEGKYGVELDSTVTPLERNRVAININIVEGETATIRKINLIGNQQFEEDDLLDEFELGTSGILGFYQQSDQYSRQKLSGDLERLRSYYLNRGFINFKIDSTQVTISPDRQDIFITINITEGEIFTITDIKLAGDLVVEPETLFPEIHLRRGQAFSRQDVVSSSDRITTKLSDVGYAFANVNAVPEIDDENKTVKVTYFVDPGKRVYVRNVGISGNSRTRDRVIRRELRQLEAGWFSSEKLKLSRERLQRLGFFEQVTVETPAVAGSNDEVDVNIAVQEKPSGSVLAGVGYSQNQGVIFNASISQDNFLGSGKRVTAALNTSSANRRIQLSQFNPYYTIDGISRGFDLSYQETDFDELNTADFAIDVGRIGVTYGLPLSEFNRVNFGFSGEYIGFQLGGTASQEVRDFQTREGDNFINYKGEVNWSSDFRDSAFFPNRGGVHRLSAEVALPGSDLQYYKLQQSFRFYYPLTEKLVFSANEAIGYGAGYGSTTALPFFENFFVGGVRTVRGYQTNSIGPRDSSNDPIGGNLSVVGNFELLFPPPLGKFEDKVRLAAFFDIGNVYSTEQALTFEPDSFRYSVGLGLSWLSPLGALTVSFAQAINPGDRDETEFFQFNLGTTF